MDIRERLAQADAFSHIGTVTVRPIGTGAGVGRGSGAGGSEEEKEDIKFGIDLPLGICDGTTCDQRW